MKTRSLLLALGIAVTFGCQADPNDSGGPAPPYAAAAQYSREHSGQDLLVMQGNQIIYDDLENGGDSNHVYQIFSGTKSFNCALGIAAIQDGLLTSFDEVVSNTITEWQTDPKKSLITVRQLLNLTSGLSQSLLNLFLLNKDAYGFVSTVKAVASPGTVFQYGETGIAAFEELIARKLKASASYSKLDTLGYLKARVLDPIGLSFPLWLRTQKGVPILSFGAYLSAREWIKYGQLVRDHGTWNSTSVLGSALVDQCTTGSTQSAGYGLSFWLNGAMPVGFAGVSLSQFGGVSFADGGPQGLLYPGGPSDLFAAVGTTDQRMYIVRSQNMVIVRIGRGGALSDWSDAVFLKKFFGQ